MGWDEVVHCDRGKAAGEKALAVEKRRKRSD